MHRPQSAFAIVLAISTLSGCVSVLTQTIDDEGHLSPSTVEPKLYRGTLFDLECLHFIGEQRGANNVELLCLLDLPFTLVGDTVSVPYVLYRKSVKTDESNSDSDTLIQEGN